MTVSKYEQVKKKEKYIKRSLNANRANKNILISFQTRRFYFSLFQLFV
jgi:hypothetical protein